MTPRTTRMRARARRLVRAAAVAVLAAAAVMAVRTSTVAARTACGNAGQPPCPVLSRIDPAQISAPPSGPLLVAVYGAELTTVVDARLEPGQKPLRIQSQTPSTLVVIIPAGALSSGSYRIRLDVATAAATATLDAALAVGAPGRAAQPAVSLAPAPTVPPPTPTPAPVRVAAAPPASPDNGGSSLASGILIWALGLLVGAGACLYFAIRTGLIHEVDWASRALDRFVARKVSMEREQPSLDRSGRIPAPDTPVPVSRPATPTWVLAPAASGRSQAPATGAAATHPAMAPVRAAAPAPTGETPRDGGPGWGVREQTKPDGAPVRVHMPPR